MRVLITRPMDDALGLVSRLEAAGIETLLAPMMKIVPVPIANAMVQTMLDAARANRGGVIFTSANGVRTLSKQISNLQTLHCFCVGRQTAEMARDAGFEDIAVAGGDVEKLIALIDDSKVARDTPLFHVRAKDHRGHLVIRLLQKGYSARAVCAYNAQNIAGLHEKVIQEVRLGLVDGVVLYSPRTAKLFEAAWQRAGLLPMKKHMRIYALSRAVIEALHGGWGQVWYPEQPNSSMLEEKIRADG